MLNLREIASRRTRVGWPSMAACGRVRPSQLWPHGEYCDDHGRYRRGVLAEEVLSREHRGDRQPLPHHPGSGRR